MIYQLKIQLANIKPPIWRRVQVKGDITLHKLHKIIQTAMGWSESHLNGFSIHGREFGPPDQDEDGELGFENSKRAKLSQVIAGEKDWFLYTYDFGDDWTHRITVEKIAAPEQGRRYPVCLAGARSAPPEDCGGAHGYQRLLEILADPKHPEHEEQKEWVGEYFQAEEFDLEFVNGELGKMK